MREPFNAYPIKFTVGMTGKRLIQEANYARLVKVVQGHLDKIQTALITAKSLSLYDEGREIDLCLVTALAAGADQIGAEAAIANADKGWAVDAIIPFDRESYRARLDAKLPDRDASERFDGLLSKCKNVFEISDFSPMPFEVKSQQISLEEYLVRRRYHSVGQIIVRQCDLLIAIWDGAPAAGMGGTAEVVNEARRVGVPIVWINPNTLMACSIMPDVSSQTQDIVSVAKTIEDMESPTSVAIDLAVGMVLLPSLPKQNTKAQAKAHDKKVHDAAQGTHHEKGDPTSFERFLGIGATSPEQTKPTTRAFMYQALLWLVLLFAKVPDGGALRRWSGFELKTNDMETSWPVQNKLSAKIDESIRSETVRADMIATRLSHWYRSAYIGIFLCAALAVVVGMAGTFYPEQKMWFVLFELIILGIAAGVYFYAHSQKLHSRFMAARNFAEMMRAYRIPAILGFAGRQPLRPDAALNTRLINALAAKAGLPNIKLDRNDLMDVAKALTALIESQMDYHRLNAQRLSKFHHRLDLIGFSLVGLAAAVGAVFVGIGIVEFWPVAAPEIAQHATDHSPSDKAHLEHSALYLGAKALATFFGAALPALAAGLALIRFQGDFERFAERSEITQMQLEALREKLKAFDVEKSPAPYEDLVALAFSAQEILNKDLADWHFVYAARPTPTL